MVYAFEPTPMQALSFREQPVEGALAEQLASVLNEAGHVVVWLRFGPEMADPETCLAMLSRATQHVCAGLSTRMPEARPHEPDSFYGWLTRFKQLVGKLVAGLPPHTAFLLENLYDWSAPWETRELLGNYVLPALASRWLCILLPSSPAAASKLSAPLQTAALPAAPQPARSEPARAAEPPTAADAPCLYAYLLGKFRVVINDRTVERRPTSRGLAVFKYLLAHHDRPTPREVLMDKFWPDAYEPELARNSLNVAISGLRRALRALADRQVVVYENGTYQLNLEFRVWVDVAAFEQHLQRAQHLAASGQVQAALSEYEAALNLYTDDFLADDPYEEWPVVQRERLRVAYLNTLDRVSELHLERGDYAACISTCQALLARDACREDIHCRLMLCYARQDQHPLALRQYQACVEALKAELQVAPAPATTQLYQRLRRREPV